VINLGDYLKASGRLDEQAALGLLADAAEALRRAESEFGVALIDVIPSRFFVDQNGKIGYLELEPDSAPEAADRYYTAPERGDGTEPADSRSLFFGLGALLYHGVTGVLPFGEYSPDQLRGALASDHLASPLQFAPTLSPATVTLIEKCLERPPERRAADWNEFMDDLQGCRRGHAPPRASGPAHSAMLPPEPKKEIPFRKPAATSSPTGAGRSEHPSAGRARRIALRAEHRQAIESAQNRQKHLRKENGRLGVLLLLLIATALYAGWERGLIRMDVFRAFFRAEETSEAAPVPGESDADWKRLEKEAIEREAAAQRESTATPRPAPGAHAARNPTPGRAPPNGSAPEFRSERPASRRMTVSWNDPEFKQGAAHFNRAVRAYRSYTEGRKDVALLDEVESNARAAIARFEACRARAPADVPIEHYIRSAYRLISDSRQNRLFQNADH
jgi:hypothetical protein